MKLIVGLGNPGKEYEKSRHNVGFMTVDLLKTKLEFNNFKVEKKFNTSLADGNHMGERVILAKPLTYMNLSGEAIQKIAHYHKIQDRDILVIYDDLDLPLGKIRIRADGNPGTHNGVKSVSLSIGKNFPRIRIGIEARTPELIKQMDSADYVLAAFSAEEIEEIGESINSAVDASILFLRGETEVAMNKFN
jgi:PTH1 family peptidyl-tRNA hydrolase